MTPKDTENKTKGDGFFADLFDSFKQSIIFLVMIIVYNIIPAAIVFGGYYWAYMGDPWNAIDNFADITGLFGIAIADPTQIINYLQWGHYIMIVGAIIAIISIAAAFIFVASRNDKIAKPAGFIKAFLGAWGILFTYAIILVILGAIYFVVALYLTSVSPLAVTIISYVLYVLMALVPLAIVFRVVDYLLELE